ncbi:hypothetical protein [Caudoviricetes sp.]|nr:hypothetical protein [Caudoviricetes sp.]
MLENSFKILAFYKFHKGAIVKVQVPNGSTKYYIRSFDGYRGDPIQFVAGDTDSAFGFSVEFPREAGDALFDIKGVKYKK